MGNPFQDQFLKAGLVNKKQVKKAKHQKRVTRKKNKANSSTAVASKAKQEQLDHARRNQELNRQRSEKKQQQEQKAQVKQLIESNRLAQDDKGEPFNFVEDNKIKRIFIADEMAEQLSRGQLAIVKLQNKYEVVPAKVARQIAARIPGTVIVLYDE